MEAFDCDLGTYDRDNNGVAFCQGDFAVMAGHPEDIDQLDNRINFIHFRDAEGDANRFVEMWNDDDATYMRTTMRTYEEHVDDVSRCGRTTSRRLPAKINRPRLQTNARFFAICYMHGLCEHVPMARL